jgi:hypothetical protein
VYKEFKKYYKDIDYLEKVNKPKDTEEEVENGSKQLAKSIEINIKR